MRILVVEDEPRMLELLRKGLREHGFAVMGAPDGETGFELATSCEFDAVLLDVCLPKRDGFELTNMLRRHSRSIPVLMLTARDTEEDILRGLDVGADDYMTKPFSFPELIARLQSITRPRRTDGCGQNETGELFVDPIRQVVTRCNCAINLTRSEFLLLECLVRNTGQCVSREILMESVWGSGHSVSSGALDVLMSSLRGKIDVPFRNKLICTVRGAGYILRHYAAAGGRAPQ